METRGIAKPVKGVRRAQCAVRRNTMLLACEWFRPGRRSIVLSPLMHSYQSLIAWQRAHALAIAVLKETDVAYHPRSLPLFNQARRSAVSVEANIVEGYALRAPRQFRRHLRIALGSAAETECLVRSTGELGYLQESVVTRLLALSDATIGLLLGLLRRPIAAQE